MGGRTGIKRKIRQWVKGRLTERLQRQYLKRIEEGTVSYDAWIRQAEEGLLKKEEGDGCPLSVKTLPYEVCRAYLGGKAISEETADIVLLMDAEGELSPFAVELVADFFCTNEEVDLLYGDEDVLSPEGIRYTPWFKPHWSPDTLLSFFYFGSVFAVRTRLLKTVSAEEKNWIWRQEGGRQEERLSIYRLCLLLAYKCGGFQKRTPSPSGSGFPVGHIDEVLFHAKTNGEMGMERTVLPEADREYIEEKIIGRRNRFGRQEDCKHQHGAAPVKKKLSVIIPSKDHAGLLKRCISSLLAAAGPDGMTAYEVIVVDNGSTEEVRQELGQWLQAQGMSYLYHPMPFHFSQMCNLGAEAAEGEVLLFLNDDVEVPEAIGEDGAGFLGLMYQAASRPYVGAAGVKLYYPDSMRIQHAGIVNLRLGPVHKLQFKEDQEVYYYGWNRRRRNVIAVTGACLAVRKDRFLEAGGFSEELPVAFNDVDLCFSLFERGYYNVVLQDTALYHHESLSRGSDDDRAKLDRLLQEKDRLYERHPKLFGWDPFYHKYLESGILSTDFLLGTEYASAGAGRQERVREETNLLQAAREDRCLMVSLEYAGTVSAYAGLSGEAGEKEYLLQGYSFVAGSDNACFERRILLQPEMGSGERLLSVRPEDMLRPDVEANLPDQVNVGLAGFRLRLCEGELAKGEYRIGMFAREKYSGVRLYVWTERVLTVR